MPEDKLVIVDRRREPTTVLRDLLAGGSAFLMGGGPSVNEMPVELLGRRGAWTMAINNAAGHALVRPQAMVCSDPPKKFTHCVWLDPGVMKFIPTPKLSGGRAKLRRKMPDGSFAELDRRVTDCPNVWAYQRFSWLSPDDSFFSEDGACWGNHQSGCERTGQQKTVCTMLLGLRLLRYLGAKRIYLIGVDFRMTPDSGYSFGQGRTEGACASNTRQFGIVNDWLSEMQGNGTFERAGVEVFNCYEYSGLRAFPYVPFEDAIIEMTKGIEATPDLAGWYDPVK